jgi:hypothetical protein
MQLGKLDVSNTYQDDGCKTADNCTQAPQWVTPEKQNEQLCARRPIRGRRRIADLLGVSERTVSRWAAAGLLEVLYEPAENNNVMVLNTAIGELGPVRGRTERRSL